MSSDRNGYTAPNNTGISLVDWDMSSDRNSVTAATLWSRSLVDWDMSSDRNPTMLSGADGLESSRLGYEL